MIGGFRWFFGELPPLPEWRRLGGLTIKPELEEFVNNNDALPPAQTQHGYDGRADTGGVVLRD